MGHGAMTPQAMLPFAAGEEQELAVLPCPLQSSVPWP